MNSSQNDRLSAIIDVISKWRKRDPELQDKNGFLHFLKACDLGKFNVSDTKAWIRYYNEARKKRISVAELLFEKRKDILSKKKEIEKYESLRLTERIFSTDKDKRRELA